MITLNFVCIKKNLQYIFKNIMNVSKRKKGIVRTFVWEQSCSGDSGWTSLVREGLIGGE